MVVQRALTRYSRVHEAIRQDEDADDMELLQHRSEHSREHNFTDDVERAQNPGYNNKRKSLERDAGQPQRPFHIFRLSSWRLFQKRQLTGWRMGVLVALIGTTLVCLFNIVVTIFILSQGNTKSGYGTIYGGDCKKTRDLNVWVHLVVNVLSTLLLGASNYCMQVLSAPTRDELVRAHAKRLWLHIGIPSFRNLRYIARDRACMWLALLLSSMPLHLFFNSVAFTTLQANDYFVIPTTEAWMSGAPYETSGFSNVTTNNTEIERIFLRLNTTALLDFYAIDGGDEAKYNNISAEDCFNAYDSQYLPKLGNVYIVQDGPTVWRDVSESITALPVGKTDVNTARWNDYVLPAFLSRPEIYQSNGWRCRSRSAACNVNDPNEVPKDRSQWQPFERSVLYCLSEEVHERCSLNLSISIAVVVILTNMIKILCMSLTLHKYRQHLPLVTLGDAVAHFLNHPDPQTKDQCLYTRGAIESQWIWERFHDARKDELGTNPQQYKPERRRWSAAPRRRRWGITYMSFALCIIIGIVCMARSLVGMPSDLKGLWAIGFGQITGSNLLSVNTNLAGGVMIANLPQVLLSYLYLAFNALCTQMFMAEEWSTYACERKSLRVTAPVGQQRSTYWLNMPFRYAVPMQVMALLFHWLTSQSIFLVRMVVLDYKSRTPDRTISTNGFSPVAIILATCLGIVIAIIGLAIGRFKFSSAMPVAASCSAVISAACHPLPEDTDASISAVQWGAVSHGQRGGDCPVNMSAAHHTPLVNSSTDALSLNRRGSVHSEPDKIEEPVGHCTFSSLPVDEPIAGHLYA